MSTSPSFGCVFLNFGYQPNDLKAPLSLRLNLSNPSTIYKSYLSGGITDRVKRLYLIQRDRMQLHAALEVTLEDLRGLKVYKSKQTKTLEIEWPTTLRPGITYSLIVKSETRAALVEGPIQAEKYSLADQQATLNSLYPIVAAAFLPLMEAIEWDFLTKHGSIGISTLDERTIAKDAILHELIKLTPQDLEGLLRQLVSLQSSKDKNVIYRQGRMCLHFLGEQKLKQSMRSHLSHHAGKDPSPYIQNLIERLVDQYYIKLCVHYVPYSQPFESPY